MVVMERAGQRRVAILGCTGSIGRQALDVVRAHPDRFSVTALCAGSDGSRLEALAAELGVDHIGLGARAAADLAARDDVDVVLNGVVGAAGLAASLAALESGKTLALANKESLVAAGELCLAAARRGGGRMVPVDSEHAALAQCLGGVGRADVSRIVLTASGGPFRTRPALDGVTPADALAHPTWNMGPKITVDSATLMNKGLEVIEAHHLFGLPYASVAVVVHPQSVVHGIVELRDGSVLMQAAVADMRLPIAAALSYPARPPCGVPAVDLSRVGSLTFEEVDGARFPALALAYDAGRRGGSWPAALNAANEEAVQAFLAGAIAFTAIPAVVEDVLAGHDGAGVESLDDVLAVNARARDAARAAIAARRAPAAVRG
jgi:1-deoxy-D-xylulose-5-phosphate reductoisomerase